MLDPSCHGALYRTGLARGGWERSFKRGIHTLRKKDYQIVYCDGLIASSAERARLQTITAVDSFTATAVAAAASRPSKGKSATTKSKTAALKEAVAMPTAASSILSWAQPVPATQAFHRPPTATSAAGPALAAQTFHQPPTATSAAGPALAAQAFHRPPTATSAAAAAAAAAIRRQQSQNKDPSL